MPVPGSYCRYHHCRKLRKIFRVHDILLKNSLDGYHYDYSLLDKALTATDAPYHCTRLLEAIKTHFVVNRVQEIFEILNKRRVIRKHPFCHTLCQMFDLSAKNHICLGVTNMICNVFGFSFVQRGNTCSCLNLHSKA